MKVDLTDLVMVNPTWLLTGLLIYFLLSLFKVHIIWDIQPKIYQNLNEGGVFKNYFKAFFQSLFNGSRLLKATIRYLFWHNEKDFLLVKGDHAKSINKRLAILDGFTTFLKPYLIFALLWMIAEYWISRELLYDESRIAFGEIQKLLVFIEGIPVVKDLQDNKGLIFLFYGILCVLIPFLYNREDSTKKFKKYFSQSLLYLSLVANISFFGVQTGKTTLDKSRELATLQAEITAIHDSIYKELVVGIEVADFRDDLICDDNLYKEEINRFDSLIKTTDNLQIDSSLKVDLRFELVNHLALIERNSTVENSIISTNDTQLGVGLKSAPSYFSSYYQNNFSSAYSSYKEYMGDKSSWNKETGESIIGKVKSIVREDALHTAFEKKLEKILGCLFDFGFDASLKRVFDELEIHGHKTLKKVVSTVFSENYKRTIIEKSIKILNYIELNYEKAKEAFKGKSASYRTASTDELKRFAAENNEYLSMEKNKFLEANIKSKINSFDIILPSNSEILNRLGVSTESEAIELLNEFSGVGYNNGYEFSYKKSLIENIEEMEREAYFKVFMSNYYSNNLDKYSNYLLDYNRLLANQSSNLTLMSTNGIAKFVGSCDGSSATICGKCGLPCAFPVCMSPK